jgi:DNA polymerase elongation subunit (family B)
VRRDGAKIVGDMQRTVTEIMFEPRAEELNYEAQKALKKGESIASPPPLTPLRERLQKAIKYVKERVRALKLGKVDLSDLIVSKVRIVSYYMCASIRMLTSHPNKKNRV